MPAIKEFNASFFHTASFVCGVQLSLAKGARINLTKAEVYNDIYSAWKKIGISSAQFISLLSRSLKQAR